MVDRVVEKVEKKDFVRCVSGEKREKEREKLAKLKIAKRSRSTCLTKPEQRRFNNSGGLVG